jgi:HSP20 family protein
MTELKVREGKEGLAPWPGFDMPLFRGSLFTMNPFTLMKHFTEDLDRAFTTPTVATNGGYWSPALEVKEKDGKYLVTAELPGLAKSDVKIHVTDEALILEGEKKHEKEEKRDGYYHCERSFGKFYRSIPLPDGAESEKVSAEFTNGVLEVFIPVAKAKAKRREIPVVEGARAKEAGG